MDNFDSKEDIIELLEKEVDIAIRLADTYREMLLVAGVSEWLLNAVEEEIYKEN